MDPVLIAVLCFFGVAIVVVAVITKKRAIQVAEQLPGEITLHEESGVKIIRLAHAGTPGQFLNCRLRITDRRLLVGVKPLLGKALMYVIAVSYGERQPSPSGGDIDWNSTGVHGHVPREWFDAEEHKGKRYLRLSFPGHQFPFPKAYRIEVKDLERCLQLLSTSCQQR